MKKRIAGILVVIVLITNLIAGQTNRKSNTSLRFAVMAGVNIQNFYGTNSNGEKLNYDFLGNYHGGINAIIPFGPDLFIQPGLFYSTGGSRQEILQDQIRSTLLSYIELPVSLLFRPQLGDGHILIGVGPYAAYGLKGWQDDDQYGRIPVKFMNEADLTNDGYIYYRPFDGGVVFQAGYELFSGIFFQMEGQLGLMKINSKYLEDKATKKHIGVGLSAGYRF